MIAHLLVAMACYLGSMKRDIPTDRTGIGPGMLRPLTGESADGTQIGSSCACFLLCIREFRTCQQLCRRAWVFAPADPPSSWRSIRASRGSLIYSCNGVGVAQVLVSFASLISRRHAQVSCVRFTAMLRTSAGAAPHVASDLPSAWTHSTIYEIHELNLWRIRDGTISSVGVPPPMAPVLDPRDLRSLDLE